jgi:hypothetical protein
LEVSKQSEKYLFELLAEFIVGIPIEAMGLLGDEPERYQSNWMAHGQETEDQIWKCYETYAEEETGRGGIFLTDSGLIGASPDRVVGKQGLLEAKAPGLTTQISYALSAGPRTAYNLQVQGQLMVSERDWVDLFAWHPKLFIPPVRVYRDEKTISIMQAALESFVATMLEARELLETRFGPFVRETAAPLSDEDPGALGVTQADVEEILRAQGAKL